MDGMNHAGTSHQLRLKMMLEVLFLVSPATVQSLGQVPPFL
jgi:hypothetical protein